MLSNDSIKITHNSIEKAMESILEDARTKIQDLADEFRTQRLIPFCKRHRLTYLAGNGMTCFYRDDKSIHSWDLKALEPIEKILDIEAVGYNDCLGFYVDDVTEEDIK